MCSKDEINDAISCQRWNRARIKYVFVDVILLCLDNIKEIDWPHLTQNKSSIYKAIFYLMLYSLYFN